MVDAKIKVERRQRLPLWLICPVFVATRVRLATDIRSFDNGLRYFFLKDPDGILVEIIEAK